MMFDIFCLSRGHQILNTGYMPVTALAHRRSTEPLQSPLLPGCILRGG